MSFMIPGLNRGPQPFDKLMALSKRKCVEGRQRPKGALPACPELVEGRHSALMLLFLVEAAKPKHRVTLLVKGYTIVLSPFLFLHPTDTIKYCAVRLDQFYKEVCK
jgi:hypothetical protein